MSFFIHLLAIYLGGAPLYAQTVGATNLLSQGPGAEAAAMAGTVVSTVHDPTALYWNQAGLASAGGMVSGEHLFLYDGARYDFIGLSVPSVLGTFGLGALQLDRENIVARQSIDDPGTTVSNTQTNYMLGYGRKLGQYLSVGAGIDVLDFSVAGYSDRGWGLNTGVQASVPQDDFLGLTRPIFSAGAEIQNLIEPKLTLMDDSESFPRELRAGAGLSFQTASRASPSGVLSHDRATILASIHRTGGDSGFYPALGLSYDYENLLVFRLGYDGTFSAGAGFHTSDGRFSLDYSMENKPLTINNRFTISYRFLAPKTAPQETYHEELDPEYAQAKTQAESMAQEYFATGQSYFKAQDYRNAIEPFRLAALLEPSKKDFAAWSRRAEEAYRQAEIHRLSVDGVLNAGTGQEESGYLGIAELLDLGADGRDDLLRRLAALTSRLSADEQLKLSREVFAKRLEHAQRLTGTGDLAEAQQLEETLEVFKSTENAGVLSALKEQTDGRADAIRKAFALAGDAPVGMSLAQAALALKRAFPDDSVLGAQARAALARYRAAFPLSVKERFYLMKLYDLAAVRFARRTGSDLHDAADFLAEIARRDPADAAADRLLDAMAREGLARGN